jgi:hypothetical protein
MGRRGERVADAVRRLGALGHSGDAVGHPDYRERMARADLTLGMDRFGIDHFASGS